MVADKQGLCIYISHIRFSNLIVIDFSFFKGYNSKHSNNLFLNKICLSPKKEI